MKHLKMLGLAAVAATALMAFVGVASAAALEFHSSAASAKLVGNQSGTHKFTVKGTTVTCKTAEFTGTGAASGHSVTQEVHPTYTNCTAFGFAGATVNTAGCMYEFNANTATVALKSCTSGKIEIHVSLLGTVCHVNVPNQTGINGISYENQVPRTTFNVNAASTNISYEVTESKGTCPLTKGEKAATAEYAGLTVLTANGGAAELFRE